MKEAKIVLAVAAICIGLIAWRITAKHRTDSQDVSSQPLASKNEAKDENQNVTVSAPPIRPKVPVANPSAVANAEKDFSFKVDPGLTQEQQELKSLENYSKALYLFTAGDQKPETLVRKLNEAGLKPLVVQDFNDVTGKMAVIRTDETLPGTRYFHAQYFEDENKQPFLQHMSFEYRPGEKSFEEAIDSVQKQFGLGSPKRCTNNFVGWNYGDMSLWILEMDAQDIAQADATRAHGPEDVGTIRVTIEQNPHPHEDVCSE